MQFFTSMVYVAQNEMITERRIDRSWHSLWKLSRNIVYIGRLQQCLKLEWLSVFSEVSHLAVKRTEIGRHCCPANCGHILWCANVKKMRPWVHSGIHIQFS